MLEPIVKLATKLSSKRDLRAEILNLAATVLARDRPGELQVVAPLIHPDTIQAEWQRLLPAISDSVRGRMSLNIVAAKLERAAHHPLPRPNYRYEALRLLIGAKLEDAGQTQPDHVLRRIATGLTPQQLIDELGTSQTPVRSALADLEKAGVVWSGGPGRGIQADPEALSMEVLGRLNALPQVLRFRFERGARLKPPLALLERVRPLLRLDAPPGWQAFALSGVPIAIQEVPELDLVGLPRLDLVASIERDSPDFDLNLLRLLDDGLELEPNVLAAAPVVVTLVRSGTEFFRSVPGLVDTRCATPADVLMALLDMGLREQALQYAKGVPK